MTTLLYRDGQPAPNFVENHEHVSPISAYLKVFGGLLVLTGLTYAVSYMNLGSASLIVAMLVAVVKASLVCIYFMHLKYDDRYHIFVFLSSLLFVTIFFMITIFDLRSRTELNEEQGSFFKANFGGGSLDQQIQPVEATPSSAAHK